MPTCVLTLAIETSNPSSWEPGMAASPGVAVLDGVSAEECRVLAAESIDPTRRHDDDLVPAIDRAVRSAGIRATDLSRIAVSAGPGGFTAVRMAVTVAKSIADAVGAACVPVPSAYVAAGAIRDRVRFAVALASKADSTYVTVFSAEGSPIGTARLITGADVPSLGCSLVIADRFLPEAVRRAVTDRGWEIRPPVFDPVVCGRLSMLMEAVEPALVLPVYPRPPEAIRKWRELHGGPDASASTRS